MPKSKLGQGEALKIAKKIGAQIQPDGPHQTATLWIDGTVILRFGIRQGRKTGQGHLVGTNHPLRLNATKALALAQCTLKTEQYFDHLKAIGVIPTDNNEAAAD